jgi:hypothetical protein
MQLAWRRCCTRRCAVSLLGHVAVLRCGPWLAGAIVGRVACRVLASVEKVVHKTLRGECCG